MTTRAQGWYRDPDDPTHHRWWTGEEWQSQEERLDDAPSTATDSRPADQPTTDLD